VHNGVAFAAAHNHPDKPVVRHIAVVVLHIAPAVVPSVVVALRIVPEVVRREVVPLAVVARHTEVAVVPSVVAVPSVAVEVVRDPLLCFRSCYRNLLQPDCRNLNKMSLIKPLPST
jgi:hypothetical protein